MAFTNRASSRMYLGGRRHPVCPSTVAVRVMRFLPKHDQKSPQWDG
jgi:hypothetical protein